MIEEAHQNGTLSVSTMYRRFFMPRGTRLIRKPPRFSALLSAFALELYEPWNMKAYPSPAGFFLRFIHSPHFALLGPIEVPRILLEFSALSHIRKICSSACINKEHDFGV
jgi:hypothetical protein